MAKCLRMFAAVTAAALALTACGNDERDTDPVDDNDEVTDVDDDADDTDEEDADEDDGLAEGVDDPDTFEGDRRLLLRTRYTVSQEAFTIGGEPVADFSEEDQAGWVMLPEEYHDLACEPDVDGHDAFETGNPVTITNADGEEVTFPVGDYETSFDDCQSTTWAEINDPGPWTVELDTGEILEFDLREGEEDDPDAIVFVDFRYNVNAGEYEEVGRDVG